MPRSAGTKLAMRRAAQGRRVGSALRGAKSTRRLLKNIAPEARVELAHVMEDVAPKIARQMQALAPKRTGALAAGIKWKVYRRTLRMQVGLLGSKRGRAKLFYGFILNFGRKAQAKNVQRATPGGGVTSYLMRISALPADHFVTGRYPDLRKQLNTRLKDVWNRILAKASRGAGDE